MRLFIIEQPHPISIFVGSSTYTNNLSFYYLYILQFYDVFLPDNRREATFS